MQPQPENEATDNREVDESTLHRSIDHAARFGPPLRSLQAGGEVTGVFARMMEGLASEGTEQKTIMIDATYLKAHRTASSLRTKDERGGPGDQRRRLIGRTKGGMNTK